MTKSDTVTAGAMSLCLNSATYFCLRLEGFCHECNPLIYGISDTQDGIC